MVNKIKILTEASGGMTSAYLFKAIKEAGCFSVASDVDDRCFGRYLADDFILMPYANDKELWLKIEKELQAHQVNVVLPSLDESLSGWAERKNYFKQRGVEVIISDQETIDVCQDKWTTYNFFKDNGIPTPESSLEQRFPLIKPRFGRGGVGVEICSEERDMQDMISQELAGGVEFTIDVFCDRDHQPVYIVPRTRGRVLQGKSTAGLVRRHELIERLVQDICAKLKFSGPINIQCFLTDAGQVKFIEINPRIAGGMALGFAATENWIGLIISNLLQGRPIIPKPVAEGLEMRRYYAEVFIPAN